jgi:hypothetical protein
MHIYILYNFCLYIFKSLSDKKHLSYIERIVTILRNIQWIHSFVITASTSNISIVSKIFKNELALLLFVFNSNNCKSWLRS